MVRVRRRLTIEMSSKSKLTLLLINNKFCPIFKTISLLKIIDYYKNYTFHFNTLNTNLIWSGKEIA